jgi:hypothetical protein
MVICGYRKPKKYIVEFWLLAGDFKGVAWFHNVINP